ncbi:histidine phosphatase superfamily [Microdochium trichocladiopsis]|uniref:Histidine phosphatase superfamily n=1 Tax=Microdochium trichocladiopsis TaxID=1682393 RepID=A0A9P8Y436_9PEZI|nr:histidine phosphatase superfamily [Microdochium trichocladiopsis]KAH7027216.1 histidine phosphatase superfamily [Microdochium trichocladiopsis]
MPSTACRLLALVPLAASVSASALYSTYSFNPLEHLTGIAPYFEPQDPPYMEPFLEKLGNKTNIDWAKTPGLNFLADWEPPVSEAETSLLTRVGRLEATQLGVDLDFRYPDLKKPKQVWTSSAERTFKSAQSLVRGLEAEDNDIKVVTVYESEESGADSLTPYKACPAYSSSAGSDQSEEYQTKFASPIAARFNDLASEFNFTTNDVFGMMQLCGYETVIRGRSPFCDLDLFTPDDWLGWEYSEDVRYHYNVGYGLPVAGYVGMPWVNATASLLLNSSSEEDLYVSFTHRELPPMVVVALGLFNNSAFAAGSGNINDTMPLDRINYRRAWKTSHVLPFLSNIAIERFNCSGSYGYDDDEYYRILVNSSPQDLPGCADGPGTMCSRDAFGKYIQDRVAMFDGFSEQCGVDYGNSTDVLSIYTTDSAQEDDGQTVGKRYDARLF